MKTAHWAFGLTALTFLLTACGGGNVPELRKVEKRELLVFLRADKSEVLDPHATSSGGDAFLIQQMYETLMQPSAKPPVRWEPCLAKSFEVSADGKQYTFKLQSGVKFHDGAELNAAAVKRSFERATKLDNPAAPSKLPYAEEFFGGITKIEVVDNLTVRFTLEADDPKFIASTGLFAASIISPTALDAMAKIGDGPARESWLTRHPAGTGPYTISKESDYVDSATITMTAFDGYWGGKPAISRVAFTWNQDQKVRREQLVSGAVQMIDSPAGADWPDLQGNKEIVLYTWEAENLCYLSLNMDPERKFPTLDARVRKAIAMAIDRDPLLTLYEGTAKAHHVLLPPVTLGFPKDYKPSTDTGSRSDRLKKARDLVKEAGAEGAELVLALPEVPRPYLAKPAQIADLIRQQLGEIGLTVKLEPMPMKQLVASFPQATYPMVLIGWMGETGEPDNFWTPLLSGRGRPSDSNVGRFWNAEVAAKVDAAAKERDTDKREKMYQDLEKSVHEEFRPMVPLLTAKQSMAWRAEVDGIYVDSTGTYRLHKAVYKDQP